MIRAETRALRGETYRMLRSAPVGPAFEAVLDGLEVETTDIDRGARLTLPAIWQRLTSTSAARRIALAS